jgi:hypothetical protein
VTYLSDVERDDFAHCRLIRKGLLVGGLVVVVGGVRVEKDGRAGLEESCVRETGVGADEEEEKEKRKKGKKKERKKEKKEKRRPLPLPLPIPPHGF